MNTICRSHGSRVRRLPVPIKYFTLGCWSGLLDFLNAKFTTEAGQRLQSSPNGASPRDVDDSYTPSPILAI